MPTKKIPEPIQGLVNPFSPEFLDTWKMWLEYKFEYFKFKYKGTKSEQAAIIRLYSISGKNEEVAIEIITESISRQWEGLYPVKSNNNHTNGTSKVTRESVSEEFASRNYGSRKS